jgi:hypothetical protein
MNEILYKRADDFYDEEASPLENMVRFAESYHNTEMAKVNIKPDSIQLRQLLRKVQAGDEKALDELHTVIDELGNTNIKLSIKLKRVQTIVKDL